MQWALGCVRFVFEFDYHWPQITPKPDASALPVSPIGEISHRKSAWRLPPAAAALIAQAKACAPKNWSADFSPRDEMLGLRARPNQQRLEFLLVRDRQMRHYIRLP